MKTVTYDPDQWQLVPKTPTNEMAVAGTKVGLRNPAINGVAQYRAMLAAAPQPPVVEVEPVAWEYRWLDTNKHTVTSGQWSDWERVTARNQATTVEDHVKEIEYWIDRGYKYELRKLFTSPPNAEALRQRVKELLQMITDQDYEYNRKTNALIKRHADQLATQAEQIKVAREGFERLSRLGLKDEWSNCIGSQP